MSESKVKELSIANCLDYICTDLQKIEALAWHGLKNRDHRTKKEMTDDFDQILVLCQDLRKRTGIYR